MRVASNPWLRPLARALPGAQSRQFAEFAAARGVRFGHAGRIPIADRTVDVLYTSHMLEHLDRREGRAFLAEAKRVLRPGGVLRIAVPDLRKLVDGYLATGDADDFVARTFMAVERPVSLRGRLLLLLFGFRAHRWMYDGPSLRRTLVDGGFRDVVVLKAGETGIRDPGPLNLREREAESVYVEGRT